MAFADGGSIGANGSTANNQSTLTLAVTQQCNVGELVVLVIADDNIGTGADADGSEVSSVAAGTNTFSKAKGWANNNAASQAGAAVQIWYSILTQQINNAANITITFANATLSDATAVTGRKFTTSGGTISVGATNQLSDDAADPGSLDATTSNREALRIRGIAAEVGNNTNLTATASWTAWANGNSATTGTTGEMCARAEHRIVTGTGSASNPTYVAADCASAYVAFYEDFTLTPSLYTDADTFPAPQVSSNQSVSPSLYTDADSFPAPTLLATYSLSPSLYTDADSFFAPTVAATYNLTPSLYNDSDSFFAPTITTGAVTISPSLYSDSDTFHTPSVITNYAITLALYSDADTFFDPSVSSAGSGLTPSLFDDTDTFFAPTITTSVNISPSLYADADTFYAPSLSATYSLSPSLYSDQDIFYAPTISSGIQNQDLLPSIFLNSNVFYSFTIAISVRAPTKGVGRFGPYPSRSDTIFSDRPSSAAAVRPGSSSQRLQPSVTKR